MQKAIKRVLLVFLFMIIMFSNSLVFADTTLSNDRIIIDNPYKTFTFYFTEQLKKSSISDKTAFIQGIGTKVVYPDDYSFTLIPETPYVANKVYTIVLSNGVESIANEHLPMFIQEIEYRPGITIPRTYFSEIVGDGDSDIIEDSDTDSDIIEDSDTDSDIVEDTNTDSDIIEDSDTASDIVEDTNTDSDIIEDSDIVEDTNTDTDIVEDTNTDTGIVEDTNTDTDIVEDTNTDTDIIGDADIVEGEDTDADIIEDPDIVEDEDTNTDTDIVEDEDTDTDIAEDEDTDTDIVEDTDTIEGTDTDTDIVEDTDTDIDIVEDTDTLEDTDTDTDTDIVEGEGTDTGTDVEDTNIIEEGTIGIDLDIDDESDDIWEQDPEDSGEYPDPYPEYQDVEGGEVNYSPMPSIVGSKGVNTLDDIDDLDFIQQEVYFIGGKIKNHKQYIEFSEPLTLEVATQVMQLLSLQKNIIYTLASVDLEYVTEYDPATATWKFIAIKNIPYRISVEEQWGLYIQAADIIDSLDLEDKTNAEKAEDIALYLLDNLSYDQGSIESQVSIYGQTHFALLKGKTVCSGYAYSYSYLLNLVGIKSNTIVVDYEGISHIYNEVFLEKDVLVYTDLTFMDKDSGSFDYDYYASDDIIFHEVNKRTFEKRIYGNAPWAIWVSTEEQESEVE